MKPGDELRHALPSMRGDSETDAGRADISRPSAVYISSSSRAGVRVRADGRHRHHAFSMPRLALTANPALNAIRARGFATSSARQSLESIRRKNRDDVVITVRRRP